MTTSNDPDQIRADIERTRAELSGNVDTLSDTANPKNIAGRQVDKVKGAARDVKDRIMGSPNDSADDGTIGDARHAVAGAPGAAKAKTQGNPLAAGLIAFGAGLLIASLIPSSQREQDAVGDLQQKIEPLKQRATDVAKDAAQNLQGPAQDAVESVKASATDAADTVKDEGQSAKAQVQDQAEQSKTNVQDAQSS